MVFCLALKQEAHNLSRIEQVIAFGFPGGSAGAMIFRLKVYSAVRCQQVNSIHHEANTSIKTNYKVCLLKVNKTFEDLKILQELNAAWMEVGPWIKNYMESSVEIQMLQVGLSLYRRAQCIVTHFTASLCLSLCLSVFVFDRIC